jgi:hypothetical protein
MPITPFHFGVGVLGKGVLPARMSIAAFVVSQIVIDCETAYFLFVAQAWPVHRWVHTFVGGTLVGLAAGFAWGLAGRLIGATHQPRWRTSELAMLPSVIGGTLGGVTHADVQPFRPFVDGNPVLDVVPVVHLHLACVAAAAFGAGLLMWRRARRLRSTTESA